MKFRIPKSEIRNSPVRVLHVIPSISQKAGGPSQAILPMCRALSDQEIDLVLLTTDDGLDRQQLIYGESSNFQGVQTIFFPAQLGDSFKYSRPLSGWLRKNVASFDLIHIHAIFNHACIAAARACRKFNVPYIVRPLGTLDPWSMKQKALRKSVFWHAGIRKMLTAAAGIHYTARAEQDAVEQSFGLDHGFVSPLGVEMNDVQKTSTNETPYVLVLSRVHPKKNLELLIDSFLLAVSAKEFSSWRLIIAGDGEEAYVRSLKQVVADRNASSSVVFVGWVSAEKKYEVLANAALLALVSSQENFGLCVAEAMASGVPVLVSEQVNLAEEIKASNSGWVVPLDRQAIRAALVAAMSNQPLREIRGQAGHDFASRKFTWTRIAADLATRYESILLRPRASNARAHLAVGVSDG